MLAQIKFFTPFHIGKHTKAAQIHLLRVEQSQIQILAAPKTPSEQAAEPINMYSCLISIQSSTVYVILTINMVLIDLHSSHVYYPSRVTQRMYLIRQPHSRWYR